MHVGRNTVRVVSSEMTVSKKGDPMVVIEIESIDSAKCLKMWKVLSEAGFEFSCEDLTRMGWNPRENLYQFNKLYGGADSALVGLKTFDVEIVEEEYDGKPSLSVKYIHGEANQIPQDDLLAFCARMRKKFQVPDPAEDPADMPF